MSDLKTFVEMVCTRYEQSGYCTEEDQELPPRDVLEEVCQTTIALMKDPDHDSCELHAGGGEIFALPGLFHPAGR